MKPKSKIVDGRLAVKLVESVDDTVYQEIPPEVRQLSEFGKWADGLIGMWDGKGQLFIADAGEFALAFVRRTDMAELDPDPVGKYVYPPEAFGAVEPEVPDVTVPGQSSDNPAVALPASVIAAAPAFGESQGTSVLSIAEAFARLSSGIQTRKGTNGHQPLSNNTQAEAEVQTEAVRIRAGSFYITSDKGVLMVNEAFGTMSEAKAWWGNQSQYKGRLGIGEHQQNVFGQAVREGSELIEATTIDVAGLASDKMASLSTILKSHNVEHEMKDGKVCLPDSQDAHFVVDAMADIEGGHVPPKTEAAKLVEAFAVGDRVAVTNVAASPPKTFNGTIKSLSGDDKAAIEWDADANGGFGGPSQSDYEQMSAGKNLYDLHHARKLGESMQLKFARRGPVAEADDLDRELGEVERYTDFEAWKAACEERGFEVSLSRDGWEGSAYNPDTNEEVGSFKVSWGSQSGGEGDLPAEEVGFQGEATQKIRLTDEDGEVIGTFDTVEAAWKAVKTDEGPLKRKPRDLDSFEAALIDAGAGCSVELVSEASMVEAEGGYEVAYIGNDGKMKRKSFKTDAAREAWITKQGDDIQIDSYRDPE